LHWNVPMDTRILPRKPHESSLVRVCDVSNPPKLTSWKSRGARAPVPHSWRANPHIPPFCHLSSRSRCNRYRSKCLFHLRICKHKFYKLLNLPDIVRYIYIILVLVNKFTTSNTKRQLLTFSIGFDHNKRLFKYNAAKEEKRDCSISPSTKISHLI